MINARSFSIVTLAATVACIAPALADAPSFNMAASTPVGSWVEREQRTIDHRQRETVTTMRQSMVGKQDCGGETCYWVETMSTSYKVKKGKRKQQGKPTILKVLVAQSVLEGDPANIVNNPSGYGKEIIIQTGDAQPVRIREGGTMAGMMMQALGIQVDYQFASAGRESVDIPAGTFQAEKFQGTGSVEGRVLIQKISVQSETQIWMTPDIPFGFARMETDEIVNGKPQKSSAHVTSFGMQGAESQIAGEPMDMMGGQEGFNLNDVLQGSGG